MNILKERPKKNQIYLIHKYRDGIEQAYDMIFWNEKYLNELIKYDRLDDSVYNTMEIIDEYKNRLAEILKVSRKEAEGKFIAYCIEKTQKVKRVAELNLKWLSIESTGLFITKLEEFMQDKQEIDKLTHELGTWKYFLNPKPED